MIIQNKRGLSTNWTNKNPVLAEGEFGLETDTNKIKFGNGTLPWNELEYIAGSGGSGGLNVGRTILWEGQGTTVNQVLNLSDTYTNYDYIICYMDSSFAQLSVEVLNPQKTNRVILDYTQYYTNTWSNIIMTLEFSEASCTIVALEGNIQGYISRIEGIKLYNSNTYSTTEQEIGTWIDGKKLYQKTFDYTVTVASNEITVGSIVGSDKVVDIQCTFTENGSSGFNNYYPVSYLEKTRDRKIQFYDACCALGTSTGHDVIVVGDFLTTVGTVIYVTVKYTKTTD